MKIKQMLLTLIKRNLGNYTRSTHSNSERQEINI